MTDQNIPEQKKPKKSFFNLFERRKEIPIETRSYGGFYAALAGALFLFTLWAVIDEGFVRRPWKEYQRDFRDLKISMLEDAIAKAESKVSAPEKEKLEKDIESAETALTTDEFQSAIKKINDYDEDIRTVTRTMQFAKSNEDEQYYLLKRALHEGEDTASHSEKVAGYRAKERQAQHSIDSIQALRDQISATLAPAQQKVKELRKKYEEMNADVLALRRKLESAEAMPIKIQQTVIEGFDRTPFKALKPRVDRCQTCHMGALDPMFKDAPEPFRTHPNLDLLKTHDPERFACSTCHGGQPMSLWSVEFAHGFEEFWERPLLTGKYVEASCRNCHEGRMNFSEASHVSSGKKLFVDFGCYGCHDMSGTEGLAKQAPSLKQIARKVSPEWMFQWIKNPTAVNPKTRMPNFLFSDEETEAVVAYLVDAANKEENKFAIAEHGGHGNAANGKKIFASVGCVGCHEVDNFKVEGRMKEGMSFGPNLNDVGSKVSREWMYDWLRNPKHYRPDTRMPNLRLSTTEANDLVEYLSAFRGNDKSSTKKFTKLFDQAAIAKGKTLIRQYGCYGCHDIKGMENEGKVSVALTTFAKKSTAELFFGDVKEELLSSTREHFEKAGMPLGKVPEGANHGGEDWYTWVINKMKNSRIYETEAVPQKMPNFAMSDDEAYALSIFLRSTTGDYVPPSFRDKDDEIQRNLDKGRSFVRWNNCVGCHKIDGYGGSIALQIPEGPSFGPPELTNAGPKLQENWLVNFLHNPTPVRGWLHVRMPSFQFPDEKISTVIRYFLALGKQPLEFHNYAHAVDKNLLSAGEQLFTILKCQSCHQLGGNADPSALAPSLALAPSRLKPDWVPEWIKEPSRLQPGTRMPNFFGTAVDGYVSPAPNLLKGDVDMQAKALRDFIWRNNSKPAVGSAVVSMP